MSGLLSVFGKMMCKTVRSKLPQAFVPVKLFGSRNDLVASEKKWAKEMGTVLIIPEENRTVPIYPIPQPKGRLAYA